jgi:hypothetical protein
MAVPPVSTTIAHTPRSLRDRTRREDRHLRFYQLRDNLLGPCDGEHAKGGGMSTEPNFCTGCRRDSASVQAFDQL